MNVTLKRIETGQTYLERELVTRDMIRILRRAPLQDEIDTSRYYFLWKATQSHPQIKQLLQIKLDNQSASKWDSFVNECDRDGSFLHGLAVMHWEWALEFEEGKDINLVKHHHQRAKYYWTHLFGRKGYWQTFSSKYYAGKDAPKELAENLYKEVSQTLLQHYYNRCRTSFNACDFATATFHLQCLCEWNPLDGKTSSDLYNKPLLKQEWDQPLLETLGKEAEQIINLWVSEWLKQAYAKLDDASVDLPRGISKNFKGALEYTEPYLTLAICKPRQFQRLLVFILTQANRWCYESAVAANHAAALTIIEGVKPAIEQLESILTKPAENVGASPEQKILSTSYALWAQLVMESDVKRGQDYADTAVAWDPRDRQTGELREQLSRMGVRVCLDQARSYMEAKEFQKAVTTINEIDLSKHPEALEAANSLRMGIYFNWAMHCAELANKETEKFLKKHVLRDIEKTPQMRNVVHKLEEARQHMAKALKYEPKHPVIAEHLKVLEIESKHRSYSIKLKVGIECFERDDYNNALLALEGDFPKDFPAIETVTQVRAGCFFRRAIQLANEERFSNAVADMQQAQILVPDNETVREQLAELKRTQRDYPHMKAMHEAEVLLEKERYKDALNILQGISSNFGDYQRTQRLKAVCEFRIGIQYANTQDLSQAIQHLEQATQYDPNEPAIRQQIEKLQAIQRLGGFEAIERRNRAVLKAQEVFARLNAASSRNPLTSEEGFRLLTKLNEAVEESSGDPQITRLRDQLQQALWNRP